MLAPLALLTLPLLVPCSLQEATSPEPEVRTYDVRVIERACVSVATPIAADTHLIPGFGDVGGGWRIPWAADFPLPTRLSRNGRAPGLRVDWERAFEALLPLTQSSEEDSRGTLAPPNFELLEALAGTLRVSASTSVHRLVDELLTDLEAHALHTVEASVYLLDADAIPQGTPVVLDASQVRRLLAEGVIVREESALLRADDVVYLRECAGHAFKQWISVHLERENYTDLPAQIGNAQQGFQIALDVKPSFSGGYSLRTCARRGSDLTFDSHRFGFFNQEAGLEEGIVDLPRIHSDQFGGDAVLPEGGGLLLGEQSATGKGLRVLITLNTQTPGPSDSPFLPTGNAFAPPTCLNASRPAVGSDQGWSGGGYEVDAVEGYAEKRERELEQLFDVLIGNEDLSLHAKRLGWFGTLAQIRGAEEQLQEARPFLEDLLKSAERQCAFELRFGELDEADFARATAGSELDLESLARLLPDRSFGACTVGSRTLMTSWVETSYPSVRIAQRPSKDHLAAANVSVVHDGYSASIGLTESSEFRCTLNVEFFAQLLRNDKSEASGPSPWPRAELAHFSAPLQLDFGTQNDGTVRSEWTLVGQTHFANSDRTYAVICRVVQ